MPRVAGSGAPTFDVPSALRCVAWIARCTTSCGRTVADAAAIFVSYSASRSSSIRFATKMACPSGTVGGVAGGRFAALWHPASVSAARPRRDLRESRTGPSVPFVLVSESGRSTTLRLMASISAARLQKLVEPVVTAAGYDLEELSATAAGRRSVVKVVVDRDGGVDLDAVAEVSRAVSEALDAADVTGETPYVLEVTSPGVDRPLTELRHWRRNVGRLVETGEVKGRIQNVTDDSVTLEVNGEDRTIAFTELGTGKIVLEFSRPGSSS